MLKMLREEIKQNVHEAMEIAVKKTMPYMS